MMNVGFLTQIKKNNPHLTQSLNIWVKKKKKVKNIHLCLKEETFCLWNQSSQSAKASECD